MTPKHDFREFWREIWRPATVATAKTCAYTTAIVPLVVLGLKWGACEGWLAYAPLIKEQACYDMSDPFGYWVNLLRDLPKLFAGAPPILLGILYLEWDKYKKDKPSGFTHEKGCEGHPGYTRRLKWVTADKWKIANKNIDAMSLGERRKRYQGDFNEQELLKSLRRKFARSDNKPIEDSQDRIRWRIVQMNGREVHIDLQRTDLNPATWVMTTKFFEWAGRKTSPNLVETHTTVFVAMTGSRTGSAS